MITDSSFPYWHSNIAKFEAALFIEQQCKTSPGPVRVFDIGGGDGGDWGRLLDALPNLHVTLWDPDLKKCQMASARITSTHFEVWEMVPSDLPEFDAVTSFSVIEHVKDLKQHLEFVRAALSANGTAYLAWDNGHFNSVIEVRSFLTSGMRSAKELTKTFISRVAPVAARPSHFQKERSGDEVLAALSAASLNLISYCHHNLPSLKRLASQRTPELNSTLAWLNFEHNIQDGLGPSIAESNFGTRLAVCRPN